MKAIWIEFLVVLGIVIVPLTFILRILYGRQWLEREYKLIESWGINQGVYDTIKIAIFIGVIIFLFIHERNKNVKK